MLLRIHKEGNPGRPIICNCGILTEEPSRVIETILKELVCQRATFQQDTTEFLNKIQNINFLPEKVLLVTMDITIWYSNILHHEGTAIISFLTALLLSSDYQITSLASCFYSHTEFYTRFVSSIT